MIYFEGLNSIIESVYLEEPLGNKLSSCKVFINPENITYLVGKTIIINKVSYPAEKIDTLLRNNCKIISRVWLDSDRVEIQPYILRINFNVMWNGRDIDDPEGNLILRLFEKDLCNYSLDEQVLYFPRVNISHSSDLIIDSYGNLTGLGWALQQVGENIKTDTPFCNLDLIKSKKVVL